jgi:LCP family protein required for cell wall assembly
VLYLPLTLVLLAVLAGLWGWSQVRSLGRVELGDALTPASGDVRNYLLVGSDSREGVTDETPNVGAIGTEVSGKRADTIIVLRSSPDGSSMMSIPRDLWVTNAETGSEGRINGSYNQGPANLVRTVTQNLGIPINHYVEIDFLSFAGMVDAIGGVTVDFPNPAFDPGSGLNVEAAGPNVLNGEQALAYVRSRRYTEVIDGRPRTDPTSDLGRQQRQQTFLRTVLAEGAATRNPIELARLGGAVASGVTVDTTFGVRDAWTLSRRVSGSEPETVILPTVPARRGGAAVLVLQQPEADAVLSGFSL